VLARPPGRLATKPSAAENEPPRGKRTSAREDVLRDGVPTFADREWLDGGERPACFSTPSRLGGDRTQHLVASVREDTIAVGRDEFRQRLVRAVVTQPRCASRRCRMTSAPQRLRARSRRRTTPLRATCLRGRASSASRRSRAPLRARGRRDPRPSGWRPRGRGGCRAGGDRRCLRRN
jgi:hypothetical protein